MALREELAALLAREPMAHWLARLDPVDCCVTPVLRLDEVRGHPLFAAEP